MNITPASSENDSLNDSILLAKMKEVEAQTKIPAEYVEVRLSTRGLAGAPEVFHIRNMKTKDMISLAMISEEELPEKVLQLLQTLIYEKDVNVMHFHEQEVIETLLILYLSFYSANLEDVDFPVQQSDLDWLKEHNTPEEYEEKIAALKDGRWKPKVTINLKTDVETYDIDPKTFKSTITVKSKKTGDRIVCGYLYYGDVVVLKHWIRSVFAEQDAKYALLKVKVEKKRAMLDKYKNNEPVDLTNLPVIPQKLEDEYDEYLKRKVEMLTEAVRILPVLKINDTDYSQMDITEKYQALKDDPRIDLNLGKIMDKFYDSQKFGIKPQVRMTNPITGEKTMMVDGKEVPFTRDYSFQPVLILQAIQSSSDNEYDIVSDNEDQPN